MKPIVELKDITRRYGEITALDGISLKIERGEAFTVVGPNGSGKTTLLRIMASIDKPTSGEVYFDGERVDDGNRDRMRARSTMVFQKTAIFNTTVYKNVAYGLEVRGLPKREVDTKVREALKTVKMEGHEGRPAKKLSGGEQQRVSLARALAVGAELLLLDEPTANLDPRNRSIIEEAISHVNRETETTVVMATHNMFQAESLTDRAALLLGGKTAEVGKTREIFGRPSERLASFARLENVFSGVSKVLKEGTFIVDLGGSVRIEVAAEVSGRATVFVRPEDIILSKEPVASSARNSFRGSIVEISDLGPLVKVKVDAGRIFVAQITKRSLVELGFNIGSKAFLTFKASSVHVT